jgi:hypothetical protein
VQRENMERYIGIICDNFRLCFKFFSLTTEGWSKKKNTHEIPFWAAVMKRHLEVGQLGDW